MRHSILLNLAVLFLLMLCGLLLAAMLWPLPEQNAQSRDIGITTTAPAAPHGEPVGTGHSGPREESVPLPSTGTTQESDAEASQPCPPAPREASASSFESPMLPQELSAALRAESLGPEDLDCTQLVLVLALEGEDRETSTTCYELDNGAWVPVEGLTERTGHVGKNGLAHDRRRNTETTPAGLWALGYAFGNSPQPENMAWPWRDVGPNSDWVCDENSPYFNTWQERGNPELEPWSDDVEHLADYPTQYAYACVIAFNTPPGEVIPSRGCAIFLHCSKGPTGGCVGLPEAAMIRLLQWLDPAAKPMILITAKDGVCENCQKKAAQSPLSCGSKSNQAQNKRLSNFFEKNRKKFLTNWGRRANIWKLSARAPSKRP